MSGEDALRADVLRHLRAGAGAAPEPAAFAALALRAFAHQYARNAPYRAYCDRRGLTPASVRDWRDAPAVPTAAFREVPLVCGSAAAAQRVFRTSGTTRGAERRGAHHVRDLALYDASLEAGFRHFVLPDGAEPRMLSLVPPPEELPDSSLAYMIGRLVPRGALPPEGTSRDASAGGFFASVREGVRARALAAALRRAEEEGAPVALLGTSLAFLDWLEALPADTRFRLPPGSRIMDTGGYKGSGRSVPAATLREIYATRLGIPAKLCVNEYGMTELCSQFYDTALRDALVDGPAADVSSDGERAGGAGGEARRKAGPWWIRARVMDPETLAPCAPGDVGILQHFDLANLESVSAVQTEDVGRAVPGGFVLLGRAAGAPPRGCSIAMDVLLRAVRERSP